jgi:NADPH:quinone reductase-like Zn-dependent oxidoreductase
MNFRCLSVALALACSQWCAGTVNAAAPAMRAVVATDGTLTVQSVPIPEPQAEQVRIKVHAASVNPVDWKLAARAAPGSHQIPGRDLAGIVDAVGPGADRWRPGDAVIAVATGGAYAEYALAHMRAVASKPMRMSFAEAAGVPIVAETAWRAMVTVGDVQKGQRVLIHGGAGGVGSSAVQIAKARGAYVIATASPAHAALVRSLGADELIDYHTVRFEERVKNVDVVLNTVDADTGLRSVAVLKPGGILVSVVGPPPEQACAAAHVRCAITGPVTGELLAPVVELADAGKFRIKIEQQLPLEDAAKAWAESRAGHTGGKIILTLGR